MGEKLIYTVEPSGAGKDSLLAWLRSHMSVSLDLHFARRCITRPAQANGELHESVDTETYQRLRDSNGFALHWGANGLLYGVRNEELTPLQSGRWVIVNGSRAHLRDALLDFPALRVVHIIANQETLRRRLQTRGRETPNAIESRVTRSVNVAIPENVPTIEITNDGALEAAGHLLGRSLHEWIVSSPTQYSQSSTGA